MNEITAFYLAKIGIPQQVIDDINEIAISSENLGGILEDTEELDNLFTTETGF